MNITDKDGGRVKMAGEWQMEMLSGRRSSVR